MAQREAALEQAMDAVRIARLETRAALAEAEVAAEAAAARRDRAEALAQRGVVSTAARDDLEATSAQAEQVVLRARAAVARWGTGPAADQPEVIVAARTLDASRLEAARAALDLSRAEVRAPVAGTILEIARHPGERPGPEGVLTMVQTDRMLARVEVFQLDIGRVRNGQHVAITAAPLDTPLSGQVERTGLLVGRQNMVSDDTAANTDARVVEVIVRLDPDSSARAAPLSNLQAMARIAVGAP